MPQILWNVLLNPATTRRHNCNYMIGEKKLKMWLCFETFEVMYYKVSCNSCSGRCQGSRSLSASCDYKTTLYKVTGFCVLTKSSWLGELLVWNNEIVWLKRWGYSLCRKMALLGMNGNDLLHYSFSNNIPLKKLEWEY